MKILIDAGKALALAGALSLSAAASHAAPTLLWDNGVPDFSDAWNFTNTVHDDFAFAGTRTITSVDAYVYSLLTPHFASDLLVRIDGVDAGVVAVTSVVAGTLTANGSDVYQVSFDLVDIDIAGGTHTLQIGTPGPNGLYGWAWTGGVQLGPSTSSAVGLPAPAPTDVAFRIYGNEVPEPASIALTLGALAGLFGARGRRASPAA